MKVPQDNDVLYQQQSGNILAICTNECIDNWLMAEITASLPIQLCSTMPAREMHVVHTYDMK